MSFGMESQSHDVKNTEVLMSVLNRQTVFIVVVGEISPELVVVFVEQTNE